ncbi:type IV toxin-antitoxin system AbiEi family antitoxin domain-containing protein [Roseovarius sp. CAU 1744]|uniref:type IV toxin-antitoxin system AbiEi family antitoxin domain-containing protein n=1 Tax=Roseovarius sp. CAU 1744 TaxID=3140368 RepID=UPI00325AFF9D
MSGQEHEKIKNLLEAVPAGFLIDSPWLERHGIGRRSSYAYVQRGWLERLNRGVFRRPAPNTSATSTVDWKTCLLSMQRLMHYDVHVGGTTALAQQGYDHYLRLGSNAPVWVYGADVPNWLSKLPLNARLQTHNTALFSDPSLGLTKDDADAEGALPWDWKLRMSVPERAVMEVMDELPDHESFHNLDMVFESLTTLRPKVLSALLHSCKKIKVKRLFFVFADRHDHPWRKHLDPQEFSLGSGDRALVKGGKIHPRYRIMVPEEFVKVETSDGA